MIFYTVRPGDYLVKIANEHGTTWQAIWNHSANAEHRRKRGSPDVLYPGDVLAIEPPQPVQPQPPSYTPPSGPPVPRPPGGGGSTFDPPWPYEDDHQTMASEPTWECPGGTCVCHPPGTVTQGREHVIVLYDGHGVRMPGARVRIYEQGRLITEEPAKANASGETRVEIRPSTLALRVEWAPPDLPLRPGLPYRKRYHVALGEDVTRATDRRLANLGFGLARLRDENVRNYQRTYHQPPTGNVSDVASELQVRHDEGMLPPFPPDPTPAVALSSPDVASELVAQVQTYSRDQMGASQDSTQSFAGEAPPTAASASSNFSGASPSSNLQGAVVPEVGTVVIFAADAENYPAPLQVAVRLHRRGSGASEERSPSTPDGSWAGATLSTFVDVAAGRWEVIATSAGKVGRAIVDVITGAWVWVVVWVTTQQPRMRVSVFDFNSSFVDPQRQLKQQDLDAFAASRSDDYSLVHTIIPAFDFTQNPVKTLAPHEITWDREYFKVRGASDPRTLENYLRSLIAGIRKRGGQVLVGYALVKGALNQATWKTFVPWLDGASNGDLERHAQKIVGFFSSPALQGGAIDIDGIVFDIEIDAVREGKHGSKLRKLIVETAKQMALVKADGVVSYYTATFNPDGTVNMPSMEPFSYSLANMHANLVARTMCYDFMSGFSNSLILKSVDYALGHGVPPSKIQMAVDPSRTPVAQLDMLVNELAARKVGLAVMAAQRSTLARTAQWDAVLSPGAEGPGLANNPRHVPLQVPRW